MATRALAVQRPAGQGRFSRRAPMESWIAVESSKKTIKDILFILEGAVVEFSGRPFNFYKFKKGMSSASDDTKNEHYTIRSEGREYKLYYGEASEFMINRMVELFGHREIARRVVLKTKEGKYYLFEGHSSDAFM